MTEKCVACGYKFVHEYEYQNKEAGILLCQNCAIKVSRHLIQGVIGKIEADYHVAQETKHFLKRLGENLSE